MNHFSERVPGAPLVRSMALLTVGVLTLTACGNGSSGGEGEVDGSSISMTVPITEAGENPYKAIADVYMKAFPDRKIVVNTLATDGYAQAVRTQLQGGNADDLIYATPGAGNVNALLPMAEAGLLEPLTGTSAESTVPESGKDTFYLDGKLYGQALDLTVVANVVNETAMKADGAAWPTDYAGLLDLCRSTSAKGKSVYAVAGGVPSNGGLAALTIAASRVYAQTPDWNTQRAADKVTFAGTPGWRKTLETIIEMNKEGCFQKGVAGADFAAITNGLGKGSSYAGFVPAGAARQLEQAAPGSQFDVNVMPGVTADSSLIFASANNALALTARSDNKAAAKAFLDWLAQPENSKQYAEIAGLLPVGDIDTADISKEYTPIAKRLSDGAFIPLPNQAWTNGEVYDALGTGLQGLITGQTTVDAVLAAMDKAWDK